ncbi:MAG: hypothetical protein F4060_00240 [Holophagales bacterium]|nr:hypothetical protein [Holophagales bacterium]MYG31586.1 hypothetical protein [Holophagales bacterium]MYI78344.1 hypothetical protein [Holophagales bacterium]
MKPLSPDNRLPDDATEDLNGQLDRLVNELASQGVTLAQAREIFERQFILASLRLNHGNITNSANHLGLHRNTLRNKVATLQIQATDYRGSSKRLQSS